MLAKGELGSTVPKKTDLYCSGVSLGVWTPMIANYLVHAGVGKQEGRIVVGNRGRGRHKGVTILVDKEIDKGRSDLVDRPVYLLCHCRGGRSRKEERERERERD